MHTNIHILLTSHVKIIPLRLIFIMISQFTTFFQDKMSFFRQILYCQHNTLYNHVEKSQPLQARTTINSLECALYLIFSFTFFDIFHSHTCIQCSLPHSLYIVQSHNSKSKPNRNRFSSYSFMLWIALFGWQAVLVEAWFWISYHFPSIHLFWGFPHYFLVVTVNILQLHTAVGLGTLSHKCIDGLGQVNTSTCVSLSNYCYEMLFIYHNRQEFKSTHPHGYRVPRGWILLCTNPHFAQENAAHSHHKHAITSLSFWEIGVFSTLIPKTHTLQPTAYITKQLLSPNLTEHTKRLQKFTWHRTRVRVNLNRLT